MENIYERLLPVCSFAIGVYFPSIVNGAADWLERLRPGKKLQAVHETLNVIATHMEKLPSSSSLTDLTGQVEKLERVISERFSARQLRQKTKATPKHVTKHVNGAALE
ncbi:hypothetical protein BST81_23580 [Leptolyngbya sp. 'hensonii']|uniref:hypothetical protein n=1 Tax=Leptolyngbya sp. 'hensonii' TaxID=1922337 RepID=UPI00094FC18C|nr:hypothetical protein [Leptolyngbya sp. 'hensonii']OLP15912.1 hypothetical protein BST81_23580 [Leptolyngbya sp. 'hensonii']